ncbi:hypothetical protein CTI12_AA458220 [Artemisia annua]|uniref:Uncharacterized protein n=1 Tax=Artemisia annua TaxID=35608 RepID=A0A2U1LSW6_ARTAN|nr:hypothetical protein CTI12_AA458220 [Artemisia annua]
MNVKTQPSSSRAAEMAGTSQKNVPVSNGNEVGNNTQVTYGNGRNGMNTGRGGYSYRGRGGMSGRAMENQKKDNEKSKPKETQVKHIAQKNFTTKNRYAALADEEDDDMQNEIRGIKINIDVACEMGIDISSKERSKWPKELQEYYEQKCMFIGNKEKIEKLKKLIVELNSDIASRSKSIEAKVTEEANDMVTEEMESTGVSRGPALNKVYNELYNNEVKQIQQLNFRKQLAEVELFVVSEQPSSEIDKKGWTKETVEYYEVRVAEIKKNVMDISVVIEDEVGEAYFLSLSFQTHFIINSSSKFDPTLGS